MLATGGTQSRHLPDVATGGRHPARLKLEVVRAASQASMIRNRVGQ